MNRGGLPPSCPGTWGKHSSESGTALSSVAAAGTRRATPPTRFNNAAHKIPKMAEVIAADLRAKILSGELAPGDSASVTESQLTGTYEVSGPTLREALRLLERAEPRHGAPADRTVARS